MFGKNGRALLSCTAILGLWLATPATASEPYPTPVPPGNGCRGTCLHPALLPYGVIVVEGIAYAGGGYYLGCDDDRPRNQQLAWHAPTMWYYYPAARICGPFPGERLDP